MLPFPFINSMGLPSSRLGFVAKPEMPPHLNILFRARPPLEYLRPFDPSKYRHYDSIISDAGNFLGLFEGGPPPERKKEENKIEKRQRELKEKLKANKKKVKEEAITWNPSQNSKVTADPYRTLFVARLDKTTDEKKLKRVFGEYGTVKSVKLVKDTKTGESKNYAFVEYENIGDFKEAYKRADGIKIDGRKILVDYERGRTVPEWKPRRLGGGKGTTRKSRKVDRIIEDITREEAEDEKVIEAVEEVKLKGTDEFKIPAKDAVKEPVEPKEDVVVTSTKDKKKREHDRDHEKNKERERSRSREREKDRKPRHSRDNNERRDKGEKKERRHHDDSGSKSGKRKKDHSKDEYEPGEIVSSAKHR